MKLTESIIFDCDGVLIDSEIIANRVEVQIKNELGFPITLEEQLRTFVGLGMSHPVMQEEHKRLPANYWELVEKRVKTAYQSELKAISGVSETLEKLALPKCVASSSEAEWLKFKLEHTKLKHYFGQAIFNGQMVKNCKPAPDLFLLVLERLKWSARTTLVVEDSLVGVQAGVAAGLRVWGFVGGSHIRSGHEQKLLDAGAEQIFSDFRKICELL